MSWDGWGPGMSGPVIAAVKRELKRRFSYAAALDDSEDWTDELTVVLTTYQERVAAEVASGARPGPAPRTDARIDWATQVQLGLVHQAPPPSAKVGTLHTVHGTGVTMWDGPPADLARAVEGDWEWQPTGDYPAHPFPMWQSIWHGITELRFQLRRHADLNPHGRIALAGFSQGAIVTSWVYKWDIALAPGQNPAIPGGGILHDLLPRMAAGVTWGSPMAEAGKFHGNRYAGIPVPEGQGILRDRLENTPDWWHDYGHGRNSPQGQDIYCDAPLDPSGEMMSVIADIVMQQERGRGFMGLVDQVGQLLADPEGRAPYLLDAIMSAGMFFVGGTGPHLSYNINPAIDYLRGTAAGIRSGAVAA